ncbi:MAG: HemK family protein methyltransferase [Pseudonocardia sp.]
MSHPETSPARRTVVARLRAAGCVFAEDEARLLVAAADGPHELAALVARRVTGQPLEHVLGWAEFCGLRIAVEPGVFVPRRRSELLVTAAVGVLTARCASSTTVLSGRCASSTTVPAGRLGAVVVDLCCGSGAIGAALAAAVPGIDLHATDVDPAAVRCARRNLPTHHVYEGDLDAPLPATLNGRVDVLVANVPYVPTAALSTMPPEAREHEPARALDGGPDGLDVARRAGAAATRLLVDGGHLLIETGADQAAVLVAVFATHGLTSRIVRDDARDASVVVATRH